MSALDFRFLSRSLLFGSVAVFPELRQRLGGHSRRVRHSLPEPGPPELPAALSDLSRSPDFARAAGQFLESLLDGLLWDKGFLALDAPSGCLAALTCSRRFSLEATRGISRNPLRAYLISSRERWGELMVFEDLHRLRSIAAWQHEPAFHELRGLFISEGLRTLAVAGFNRHPCLGALVLGSRKRSPSRAELRALLGVVRQVASIAGARAAAAPRPLQKAEPPGFFPAPSPPAAALEAASQPVISDRETGLKTREFFRATLHSEWCRASRKGRNFSVILVSLSGQDFSRVSPSPAGADPVLRAAACRLQDLTRHSNVVARYQSRQLAVLMIDADAEKAGILASRIEGSLAADAILSARNARVSLGVATYPGDGPTADQVLEAASSRMAGAGGSRAALEAVPAAPSPAEAAVRPPFLAAERPAPFAPGALPGELDHFREWAQSKSSAELPELLDATIALAYAVDARDRFTQGHSRRVSRLASQIGEGLGLPDSQVEEIRLAGILHDIGKLGIPGCLLEKAGPLSAQEFEFIKTHATLGGEILASIPLDPFAHVRWIVRHHHEKFDGSGYPDRLSGQEIPLAARILCIADSYDTILSERSYKKKRTVEEALAELERNSGSHFDPAVLRAFLSHLREKGRISGPAPAPPALKLA